MGNQSDRMKSDPGYDLQHDLGFDYMSVLHVSAFPCYFQNLMNQRLTLPIVSHFIQLIFSLSRSYSFFIYWSLFKHYNPD